jgi:Holliday junction resolvasome RuvABC endonuclease subunit
MIVVGIDGSTNCTGICVMKDGALIDYTAIDLHKISDTDTRIGEMLHYLSEYLDKFDEIDLILMEESILKNNVSTVKLLSYLMGGVMYYALQRDICFKRVLPTQWRAKCGIEQNKNIKRAQLKENAIRIVHDRYGIDVSDDVAESVLIAASEFK